MAKRRGEAYRRQLSHDGTYATATLMINDEALSAISSDGDDGEDNEKEAAPAEPEPPKPRKCYIFCPAGDRESLFAEVDRKTAAPLIPEFQDYVLETLTARKILRKLKVFTLSEKLDAWTLDLLPDDKNIVDVLEQGLQEGKISIPGAAPDSPDGFDGVTSVTSCLNTFGVTVGVDPLMVIRLLGHCDMKMLTKIYGHTVETLRRALTAEGNESA